MKLCITGYCNQPEFEIDNFEALIGTGEVVGINWLEDEYTHEKDGHFEATMDDVCIDGAYADGRGEDLQNIAIIDVQLYNPYITLNPQFKIDKIVIIDGDNKFEATNEFNLNFFEYLNKQRS